MSAQLILIILAAIFFVMAAFSWPQPFAKPTRWEFIGVAFLVLGLWVIK